MITSQPRHLMMTSQLSTLTDLFLIQYIALSHTFSSVPIRPLAMKHSLVLLPLILFYICGKIPKQFIFLLPIIVVVAQAEHPNSFWSKRSIGRTRYEPGEGVPLPVLPTVREQLEKKYFNINQSIKDPLLKFLLKHWKINI